MHIHGNFSNLHSAGLESAAGSDRAAAAERAAETRRRLLKKTQEAESGSSPEETLLISQWHDARHSQVLTGDESRTASSGKDTDFD
jgi:hypothetical protein